MASIKATGLVKRYGTVKAVHGIDFEIADGEFVAILGPSGCGKSSTMRMIAGLETVTEGTIEIDGKVVNDIRARDRNVAMSFESYALYPTISIYENIAFPLRSAGMNADEIDRRVRDIAEKMELVPLLGLKPQGLSSGQAQRVGLARALVRKPSVFLLDEPISHLDTRQRYRMRRFIKQLHQQYHYTMIYVTHDQEEALALADRVMVMSNGLIQQMAPPDEIYARPVNAFVAGFVGEPPINFFDCRLAGDGGRRTLAFEGQMLTLPERLSDKAAHLGSEALAAVRPHFLSIGANGPLVLEGKVFVTEELQDQNLVMVDVGRVRFTLVAHPSVRPRRGEVVPLTIDPDHLLLFPQDNSRRIDDDLAA